MQCVKTGAHVKLLCYGEWLYGDVFKTTKGDFVMRVCQRSHIPLSKTKHFTFHSFDIWFDERRTSGEENSTLFPEGVQDHGYEGVSI